MHGDRQEPSTSLINIPLDKYAMMKSNNKRSNWKFVSRYKLTYATVAVFILLMISFVMAILYVSLMPDTIFRERRMDQFENMRYLIYEKPTSEHSNKNEIILMANTEHDAVLQEIHGHLHKIMHKDDTARVKRDVAADNSLCLDKMLQCKELLNEMRMVAKMLNNSLEALKTLKNQNSDDSSNFKLYQLAECLECEKVNVVIPESVMWSDPMNAANSQVDDNINLTIRLLQYGDQAVGQNLNVDKIIITQDVSGPNFGEVINVPEVAHQNDGLAGPEERVDEGTYSQHENGEKMFEKAEMSSGNSRPTTKLEEQNLLTTESSMTTVQNAKDASEASTIDLAEPSTDSTNVTKTSSNVTEITNTQELPSERPSIDHGQPENRFSRSNVDKRQDASAIRGKQFPMKDMYDPNQPMPPTAETIKSSQQVQYTPTMSWVPYPVCIYGQPNSPVRQMPSAPYGYPISSPTGPFPLPPQRGMAYGNSGQSPNGQPNYVQVQANSVQFVPPYGGGLAQNFQPTAQRYGPTAPGPQYYPNVGMPTGGASARTPYYCTYIPAPTFQFPPISGVSEYQRSSQQVSQSRKPTNRDENENVVDTESDKKCPASQRKCNNGMCISKLKWCNGKVDCPDASDEMTCSCKDRISRDRMCDGYFDCPHGEDELGCFGCPHDSFSCGDWENRYRRSNCVPLNQRCDGTKNCVNGKDEMDCNILTPTYTDEKEGFIVGFTEGFLHKNVEGRWYPVCNPPVNWITEACASESGLEELHPETGSPSIEYYHVPDNVYDGLYVVSNASGGVGFNFTCDNLAIHVTCPPFPCGTRDIPSEVSYYVGLRNSNLDKKRNVNSEEENNKKAEKTLEENRSNNSTDDILGTELRVVGGRASQPKAWPFLVAIYKNGKFHCGGVIVNRYWILTAAHCVEEYMSNYYEVEAGMLRKQSFSPMAQIRKANFIVTQPKYIDVLMQNDLSLIRLDEPLRFNRWVRPICLPQPNTAGATWSQGPIPGTICVAIGWGAIREHGREPDQLREVEVPILDTCKYPVDQNDASICAGFPQGGRDACQGDSGGPLLCRNPMNPSQWYVAGIISHGEGCARANEPGVYSNVATFLDWIKETTESPYGMQYSGGIPLLACPGFSCNGGLGKCLEASQQCDRKVDCMDGEDEADCSRYFDYSLYRHAHDSLIPEPHTHEFNESEILETTTTRVTTILDESTTTEKQPEDVKTNEEDPKIDTETIAPVINSNEREDLTESENFSNSNLVTVATTTEAPVPTLFACKTLLQNIPYSKFCDKEYDCEDGSDEDGCTCRDYLSKSMPSAICNGYVDCVDRSDEKDCDICTEDQFLCRRSRTCIPARKKCDYVNDCPNGEDELACFALTDGNYVNLDIDGNPQMSMEGIFTEYENGDWRPRCHHVVKVNNQSSAWLIGENMCDYFGFARLKEVDEFTIKNTSLTQVTWLKDHPTVFEGPPTQILRSEDGNVKTCSGLYIRCKPVLSSSVRTHLVTDPRTGSIAYLWPWLAAIFVDGRYRCSAVLLEPDWLLTTVKCTEGLDLSKNYTTALFGQSPAYMHVDGPYQQISMVDEVKTVKKTDTVLLHLKNPVIATRYVQPLFREKKIYPPFGNDTCVAVGTDNNSRTSTLFLRPILQNCQKCYRCFDGPALKNCEGNETQYDWSGTVVCLGKGGWYPAAVFNEKNGPCSFKEKRTLTSIDYINAHIMQAKDSDLRPPVEPECKGYRCTLGQCITQDQVCNGIRDCRDGSDESPELCRRAKENCENDVSGCKCRRSELRCGSGECVPKSAFCDQKLDCPDGTDEAIACTCVEYLKLTAPERVCDGVRHCLDKSDESPEICACKDDRFQCVSKNMTSVCIPMDFVCDGEADCEGGVDENECLRVKGSPKDPPGTGEVMQRSFGVWHSQCRSSPDTQQDDVTTLCQSFGYDNGTELKDYKAEQALVPLQDEFYAVRLNRFIWTVLRNERPMITLAPAKDTCHRLFVNCFNQGFAQK